MSTYLEWATVLAFASFVGIVIWAYGSQRRQAFEEAGRLPFALPDETEQLREEANK